MFVTNPCVQDARVIKEAKTLTEAGYEVRVFALANAHFPPVEILQDGYTVVRLQFLNIFKRVQNSIWAITNALFAPFKWVLRIFFIIGTTLYEVIVAALKLLFVFVVGVVGALLAALAGFIGFRPIARDQGLVSEAQANEMVKLTARDRYLRLSRSLRRYRARIYTWLKAKLPWRYRRPVFTLVRWILASLALAAKCAWLAYKFFNRYIYRKLRALIALPRKIYRKVYRLFRILYSRGYSLAVRWRRKIVNTVNSWVYRSLLPVHKISTYLFFCTNAAKAAVLWRPDVVHAHDLNTMYAAKLVRDKLPVKVVYDSHELWVHRNRVGREAKFETVLDRWVEKWLIRKANGIITVCESIGDWLEHEYPGIPSPVILRNMPHRLVKNINTTVAPLGERLGLDADTITMIYTGKITSGRGIEIGLESLVNIPKLHFVLLGYGEASFVEYIHQRIAELDIAERVTFCDPVPHHEVTQFIYGADFALVYIEPVCLSYEFALPNKLFESIQAGIPIMGSKLVEIQNLVESENLGMCFSSAAELTENIKNGLTPEKLQQWRASIVEVQGKLCWEVEQQQLLDLYDKLAA